MARIVVRQTDRVPDCSLCRDTVDGVAISCPGCRASYHGSCLDELASRCATIGCTVLGVAAVPQQASPLGLVAVPHETSPLVVASILGFVLVGTLGILIAVIGVSPTAVAGASGLRVAVVLSWPVALPRLLYGLARFAEAITPPPRGTR